MDRWLEDHRGALAIALVAVFAVGAVFWMQRVGPDDRPLVIAASPSAAPGDLMVYVSGAVARPGVYPFRDGDRVEQAVAAAGGATADADLTALNLAVRLRDEQQVHVPRLGEAKPKAEASPNPTAPSAPGGTLVDLNSAGRDELEALPGIGPVTAQRILDYRDRNGPFRQIDDLKTNKLVNTATFEKIQGLVTVR